MDLTSQAALDRPAAERPGARADLRAGHRPLRGDDRYRSRRGRPRRTRRRQRLRPGAGRSIAATSPIAFTARGGSATANCQGDDGLRLLDPNLVMPERTDSDSADGADKGRTLFVDLETTGLERRRRDGRVPGRLRLVRPGRVPGPPVPAHELRRRARAALRRRRVLRRRRRCSSPTTARRSTCR